MIIDSRLKGVADVIKSGQGFINPISEKATAFNQTVQGLDAATLTTKAQDLANKLNLTNPDEFVNDILELPGKINAVVSSINSINDHVDQLSGKVLNKEKNIVAMLDLVKAAQEITVSCSENPDDPRTYQNNPMYKVFGSVLNAEKHNFVLEGAKKTIDEIKDFFEIDELTDYLQSLSENEKIIAIREKITKLKATYDRVKGIMDEAKQADDDGYEEVKNDVLSQVATQALSSLVGDKCANQVLSKVQSPELKKAYKLVKKL